MPRVFSSSNPSQLMRSNIMWKLTRILLSATLLSLPLNSILAEDSALLSESEKLQAIEAEFRAGSQLFLQSQDDQGRAIRGGIKAIGEKVNSAFKKIYGPDINNVDLGKMTAPELGFRLKALDLAVFYSHSEDILDHMMSIYRELYNREETTPDQIQVIYEYMIRSRRFEDANSILSQFPDIALEVLPKLDDRFPDRPTATPLKTIWKVDPDERTLTRSGIVLDGPQIVAFSSLTCNPSQKAWSELFQHERVASLLTEHALWIEPPSTELLFDATQEWNRKNPHKSLVLTHSYSEWPEFEDINYQGTPTFYFLLDGEIQKIVSGWPAWEPFIEGLETIGLVDIGELHIPSSTEADLAR